MDNLEKLLEKIQSLIVVQGDLKSALPLCLEAVGMGSPEAQRILGNLFLWGTVNKKQDSTNAFKWWKIAADNGDAEACLLVGGIYYTGELGEKNYNLAYKYISESVKKYYTTLDEDESSKKDYVNYGKALGYLSMFLYNGFGCQRNYDLAYYYAELGAKEDDSTSLLILGYCFLEGDGVKEDDEKAYACFSKGAALGSKACQKAIDENFEDDNEYGEQGETNEDEELEDGDYDYPYEPIDAPEPYDDEDFDPYADDIDAMDDGGGPDYGYRDDADYDE